MNVIPPGPPSRPVSGDLRNGRPIRRVSADRVEIIPPSRPDPPLDPSRGRCRNGTPPRHAAIAAYDRADALGLPTWRLIDCRI